MKALADSLSANLLIFFTGAFAGGIILRESGFFPGALTPPLFLFAFPLLLAFIFWWMKKHRTASIALLCCAIVLGYLRDQQQWAQLQEMTAGFSDSFANETETVLSGRLANLVHTNGITSKAIVDVDHIRKEDGSALFAVNGQLLLTLQDTWPTDIQPGDAFVARARLRQPADSNTPGTFDYRTYLARQAIAVIGSVDSPLFLQPLDNAITPPRRPIHYRIERLRSAIGSKLDTFLDPVPASLYRALLIGDRSAIPEAVMESFRGAGVIHILAISGLHLGLLGAFLYAIVFWALRRSTWLMLRITVRKAALLLCIPVLFFYTLLAGFQPPIVRSFIMAVFVIIALASDRVRSPFTAVAGAALTILLQEPFALYSPSFQLSFAAVCSIILISPRFMHLQPPARLQPHDTARRWYRLIIGLVIVSIAASLGTLLLLLYHFNRMSTVTVVANLVIEPLVCFWAMVFGFLALPLLPLFPELAGLMVHTGAWALSATVKAASFFSNLPLSTIWLPAPPPWAICLYLIALALLFRSRSNTMQRWSAAIVIGLCLLVTFEPLIGLRASFRGQDRVSVIDVGHGSAVLAEFQDGRNVLFDGGCRSSPGFDCGDAIIAPYLWHRGIARLDDIVLSHADADHYNGLPTVLRRFGADRIWLPYLDESKAGYARLCRIAERMGSELTFPIGGPFLEAGEYRLSALGQADGPPATRRWSAAPDAAEDDNALVILLETPGFSMILPGDISTGRERELVRTQRAAQADILLAAHHGSSTSNSPLFLNQVNPDCLIVSTGDRQGTHFPSSALRRFVDKHRIRLLSTEEHGTISISGTAAGYQVAAFKAGEWSPRRSARD